MATPALRAVMEAIEERLETIDGLRVTPYAADQINPPQAIVTVPPCDYGAGLGRTRATLEFGITILVSAALDRVGQHNLADYANPEGTKSIRAALEDTDRTLGGLVEDLQVTRFDPVGLSEVGSVGYYGGEFRVLVLVG